MRGCECRRAKRDRRESPLEDSPRANEKRVLPFQFALGSDRAENNYLKRFPKENVLVLLSPWVDFQNFLFKVEKSDEQLCTSSR